MRTIERDVASAFIFSKDNQILLGQHTEGGVYQGAWCVPGGGIEDGETKRQAMEREILEEVGLRLDGAKVEELEEVLHGESQKTLRSTGEIVIAKMAFYDFVVYLSSTASEVELTVEDDLQNARFFALDQLESIELATGTRDRLTLLGYLASAEQNN